MVYAFTGLNSITCTDSRLISFIWSYLLCNLVKHLFSMVNLPANYIVTIHHII